MNMKFVCDQFRAETFAEKKQFVEQKKLFELFSQ